MAAKGNDTAAPTELELYVPSAGNISISGRYFKDSYGRILGLRGANVGSASKV